MIAGLYGGIGGVTAYSAYITKAGGGSWGDAVRSAAFARATAKAIAHGLSQAAIAKMRYGSAKGVFLSDFIASGFSIGNRGYGNAMSRTMIMAVVGGIYLCIILNTRWLQI